MSSLVTEPPRKLKPSPWQIAEGTRLTILIILAAMAIFMGVLIAITNPVGPSLVLFASLPGWPSVWGSILAASGVMQGLGIIFQKNSLSFIGCTIACLWYLGFGAGFGVQYYLWALTVGTGVPPSIYPFALYVGLASIHGALSYGLLKYWRAEHPGLNKRQFILQPFTRLKDRWKKG